jgi:hypothetical protein
LKLWDLQAKGGAGSVTLSGEVRGCFFLRDAESLVAVDASGRLTLHTLPDLTEQAELVTRLAVQCAELSPSGGQIALGCGDGRVHLVAVEGFDHSPLVVNAIQTSRRTATVLQRLFGRSRLTQAYQCTCPVCRQSFELPGYDPSRAEPCPNCQRRLRIGSVTALAAAR